MMRYIKHPNLPESNVKQVILGDIYSNMLQNQLLSFDIEVLPVMGGELLEEPVRYHPDMLFTYIGNGEFVLPKAYRKNFESILPTGSSITEGMVEPSKPYPRDIAYNVLIAGEVYVHRLANIDRILLRRLREIRLKAVNVNQGYSKCSTCVVDNKSVITADKGIATALKSLGFDVLLITPGFIDLPGYDYGFIGGCCGKLAPNILAFTGNLDIHPDKNSILRFLNFKGIKPIFLTDKPAFDIGSIIPITEEST